MARQSSVQTPLMATVVSLIKKRYPRCFVPVVLGNGFERGSLVEDLLLCQFSTLVKYRQRQTKNPYLLVLINHLGLGCFSLKKVNLFIGGFRIDKLCYPLEINIDLR